MSHAPSKIYPACISTLHSAQMGHEKKNELNCGSYFSHSSKFDANEMYAYVLAVYYQCEVMRRNEIRGTGMIRWCIHWTICSEYMVFLWIIIVLAPVLAWSLMLARISVIFFTNTRVLCITISMYHSFSWTNKSKPKKERDEVEILTHIQLVKRDMARPMTHIHTEKILQLTWNYDWQNGYIGSLLTFKVSKFWN